MDKQKITVVINTFNEAKNVERVLRSVSWADEVVICDMHSTDETVEVAKKNGAKVIFHEWLSFVEPARNYAVSKASGDWILVLDPDEEITDSLAIKLRELVLKQAPFNFVELPRKNIIFGKWMKGSGWWPDYNIRFFKKGSVEWGDMIHRPPKTSGQGIKLALEEECAITHYHYESVTQFLLRMDRYTEIQAKEIYESGYKFVWHDMIKKPLSEFLGRFFANQGFKDGLHGLSLSFLQAFSFLIVYLKVWEKEKFKPEDLSLLELKKVSKEAGFEISYWFGQTLGSKNPFKKLLRRAKRKVS